MASLSNSPKRETLIRLEARKSYAFGLHYVNRANSSNVDLTGSTTRFVVKNAAGTVVLNKTATILTPATVGLAQVTLQASELSLAPGEYSYALTLQGATGYSTLVMKGPLEIEENSDDATTGTFASINPSTNLAVYLESGDTVEVQVDSVDGMFTQVAQTISDFQTAQAAAIADLDVKKNQAATSATQAASSATAAGTSATNAASSATAAAGSATAAGTSATNAATSATNATTQAGIATTKAGEAATSATTAATGASQASTSASAAQTSATNSATSATDSANSATAAAGSATTASTQATNASNSATAAATSATNAGTSATNAANSATAAGTSATNAATSATNAANSAAAAAASSGFQSGSGAPNGVVTGVVGNRYIDTARTNGIQEWVKVDGTGNTGWVPSYDTTVIDDSQRVNLLRNPSWELALTGTSSNQGTRVLSTAYAFNGQRSLQATSASTTVLQVWSGTGVSDYAVVTPGQVYTFSGYFHPGAHTGKNVRSEILWINSAGGTVTNQTGPYAAMTDGAWTRSTLTGVAPAGAVFARPCLTVQNTTAGEIYYFDAYQLEQGTTASAYWDGDTNPVENGTRWQGTPHASPSINGRTRRLSGIWNARQDLGMTYSQSKVVEAARLENLIDNPSFETAVSPWGVSGGATVARSTTLARSGVGSMAITSTATLMVVASHPSTASPTVVPGQAYTGSFYVNPGALSGRTAQAQIQWYNDANGPISSILSTPVTIASNTWTRIWVTGTAPAGAKSGRVNVYLDGTVTGDVYYVDDAMLHMGAAPIDYADGDSTGWAWAGTRHNSLSFRVPTTTIRDSLGIRNRFAGAVEAPRVNLHPNPRLANGVASWTSSSTATATIAVSTEQSFIGGNSIKATGVAAGTTQIRTSSAQVTDIIPGVEYTGSMYLHPGTLSNVTVTPQFYSFLSGGTTTVNGAPVTLPANTWTRVSATGLVPAGTTSIGTGALITITSPGEVCYADAMQIERGTVATPYFDGWTNPTAVDGGRWTGTPGASSSKAGNQLVSGDIYRLREDLGLTGPQAKTVEAPRVENLIRTPTGKYGLGSFINNGAQATPSVASTGGLFGAQVLQLTPTAAGVTNTGMEGQWQNGGGPAGGMYVVPGETYTVSAYVNPGSTSGLSAYVYMRTFNQAGSGVGSTTSTSVPLPVNTWTRISTTAVPTTGFGNGVVAVAPRIGINGLTSTNDIVKIDGAMFHQGDHPLNFFDGDTAGYSWQGAPGNSISFKSLSTKLSTALGFVDDNQMPLAAPRTNLIPNAGLEFGIGNWAGISGVSGTTTVTTPVMFGTRALSWTATAANSTMSTNVAGTQVPVTPGVTYTLSFYVHSGTNIGKTARAGLNWHTSSAGMNATTVGATTTLTDGGWTRIYATGVAPAGAVGLRATVEIVNSANGEVYYVDGALLEASPYVEPWFDGDSTGARWTGAPGGSLGRSGGTQLYLTDVFGLSEAVQLPLGQNNDFFSMNRQNGSGVLLRAGADGTARGFDGFVTFAGGGPAVALLQQVAGNVTLNRGRYGMRWVQLVASTSSPTPIAQRYEDVTNFFNKEQVWSCAITNPGASGIAAQMIFNHNMGSGGSSTVQSTISFTIDPGTRIYAFRTSSVTSAGRTVGTGNYYEVGIQLTGGQAVGTELQFFGWQLEAGPSYTPFQRVDRALDLTRTQRHYQRIAPVSGEILGQGYVSSSTLAVFTIPFITQMRTTPAVSTNSMGYQDLQVVSTGTAPALTAALSFTNSTAKQLQITATTTGLNAGYACGLRYVPITYTATAFTTPDSTGYQTITYSATAQQFAAGEELVIAGASNGVNNGTFRIISVATVSAGATYSATVYNPNGVTASAQTATAQRMFCIEAGAGL